MHDASTGSSRGGGEGGGSTPGCQLFELKEREIAQELPGQLLHNPELRRRCEEERE